MATPSYRPNLKRAGKFGAVGILNTLLDFLIFNLMIGLVGLPILFANIISTTIAMAFSFLANRNVVFKAQDGSAPRQAALFLIVTAFGLYVLQLGTLHFLTSVWTAPVDMLVDIIHGLHLGRLIPETFVAANAAKAVATVVSLIWNYIMYKQVVFKS